MPLLLIPLLVVALLVLAAALYPFALWQRYRAGKARRRVQRWVIAVNAVLLMASLLLFVVGAWISAHWNPHALSWATIGLLCGALLGVLGIATTRFERGDAGTWYTPNRWIALLLTLLVVARIGVGIWQFWRSVSVPALPQPSLAWQLLADHASLFAVGGLLIAYYAAYTCLLHLRLARERS